MATLYSIDYGRGRPLELELANNEYGFVGPNGRGEHRTVAPHADADAIRQTALNAELADGGRSYLVMYPKGQPRTKENRRYVSSELVAKLDEDADPNAIAAALGLTYRGELSYSRGKHMFRSGSAGSSLLLLEALRRTPGVIEARPIFSEYNEFYRVPNDPLFTNQWHLLNIGQQGATPGVDANVTNVWERYRGSNVFLAVFDSGYDLTHPDLVDNFRTNAAYDPVSETQDVSARPGEFHGTAVSGIAAARGDNAEGGSGAAPEASIIPIRFEFGSPNMTTDDVAQGLSHSNGVVQVHNNSWGRDGSFFLSVRTPEELDALTNGITFGRSGLGTIYVFSSGNSGDIGEDNNYKDLTKSMFTIAVNALNDLGDRASYSTFGAASVISAPSGLDATRFQGSTTTDMQGTNGYNNSNTFPLGDYTNRNYTANFNGTSSAAPLVSGVIALMLDANPNLGWRDVQEIVMRSATMTDTNNGGWMTNAAGFHFNHEYGAGMINADGAVQLAEGWTNLGLRTNLVSSATALQALVSDATPLSHTFTFTNTEFRIEHVQLRTDISHPIRGDLQITLTAPSGTRSILSRVHSDFSPDYVWEFNSVFHWGELAAGDWTVDVQDLRPGANGIVNSLALEFFGTISNSVFISLTNPPAVLNHPLSRTATKGSDVLFRVNAVGSGQLNYRWLFNGNELSGQNSPTLIVNDVTRLQQGNYHARIDNQFGTVVSAGASLFVNSPPEITAQPVARSVNIGDTVTLNVSAVGNNPLSYQWRFNGSPITNATGTSLSVSNFQSGNIGNYDVVVQNPLSSIISEVAVLSANTPVVFSGASFSSGPGSTFMFNFSGNTGQTFRVDGSIDLRTWSTLNTIVLTNGTGNFSDGTAATFTNRYYRVVPLP